MKGCLVWKFLFLSLNPFPSFMFFPPSLSLCLAWKQLELVGLSYDLAGALSNSLIMASSLTTSIVY